MVSALFALGVPVGVLVLLVDVALVLVRDDEIVGGLIGMGLLWLPTGWFPVPGPDTDESRPGQARLVVPLVITAFVDTPHCPMLHISY